MLNPTQIQSLRELADRYVADAIKARKAGRESEYNHFYGCAIGITSSLTDLGHSDECSKIRRSLYAQVTPTALPCAGEEEPHFVLRDWRIAHKSEGLTIMVCIANDDNAEVWAVDKPGNVNAHIGFPIPDDEDMRLSPLKVKKFLELMQTELPEEEINVIASGLTRQLQIWRTERTEGAGSYLESYFS
jgi:hypothetical protein